MSSLPSRRASPAPDSVHTSFGQRFGLAVAGGLLTGLLARVASGDEGWTAIGGYVGGNVLGASLAGHAREGARPLGAALGALLCATPLLILWAEPETGETSGAVVLVPIAAFTVPIGAAWGHAALP